MMQEALESLIAAVQNDRTDIVRSVLATFEKSGEEDDDKETLNQVLSSLASSEGTVLHLATKLGSPDAVRTLLSAGADPGIHNTKGQTPLDLAANTKVIDVFNEELLQSTAQSNIGRVCQLIAAGVSVNLEDSASSKNTPLHWAASYGNREVVQCLCARGASVNTVNVDGATALHDAVHRGDIGVVEELIQAGASPMIRATNGKYGGKTALDLAAEKPEILQILNQVKVPEPLMNGSLDDTLSDADVIAEMADSKLRMNSVASIESQQSVEVISTANGTIPDGRSRAPPLQKLSEITMNSTYPLNSLVTDDRLHMLWPQPQKIIQHEGQPFEPQGFLRVVIVPGPHPELLHKTMDIWRGRYDQMFHLGLEVTVETAPVLPSSDDPLVVCEVNRKLFSRQESYRLSITQRLVRIQASDLQGVHHGITTFVQLLALCGTSAVPQVQIHDWPSLQDRGILLDLSKGRVPKPEIMANHLHVLSSLKINQVYYYVRFQVPEEQNSTWQFPYPRSTLLDIERLCSELHMTLIPAIDVAPMVTYVDLPQLYPIFQHFLTCFPSSSVVSIGPRLSGLLLDTTEDDLIQAEEITRLIPVGSHHTLQLCAFAFHNSPGSLHHFPCNTILVEYGFQATYNFQKHCKTFSDSGIPFYVAPGTSAWNSIAGCPEAAVSNVFNAMKCAVPQGSLGMIVCNWSGVGHVTHFPISWPGFVTAAGLSWNCETHWDYVHANLAELINQHVVQDRAGITGQVIIELGRAETYVIRCARKQQSTDCSNLPAEKGSSLFQLLGHPDQVALENLSADVFQKAMRHIRKCQSELTKAILHSHMGGQTIAELQLTADLMLSACRVGRALVNVGKNPAGSTGYAVINLGVTNLPPTMKTDLANRLLSQIDQYRSIWLANNMPQGLQDSLLVLSNMLKQFVPEDHTEETE